MPEYEVEKLLLTIAEAQQALSVGRTKLYALIASGDIPVVRWGSSIRIPVKSLNEWVESHLKWNN